MILVLSTSGPVAAVAWFDMDGALRYRGVRESLRNASGAVGDLLAESGRSVREAQTILCDVGPGSFTGVRVGVTMAKVMAAELGCSLFSITAFDLFDSGSVAIPSKPGKYFLRIDGELQSGASEAEANNAKCRIVEPADWHGILDQLPDRSRWQTASAESLVPLYVAEPGISQAKQPHIMGETVHPPQ